MLSFSIGLPGRFSEWCDTVVAHLVGWPGLSVSSEQWPGTREILGYEAQPATLERLAHTLICTEVADLVIGARSPDDGLYRALAENQARCLVAIDHPRLAAADLLEDFAAEPRPATRAVANSCALLMRYGSLPGAMVLHADGVRDNPAGTVVALARHFRGIADHDCQRLIDHFAAEGLLQLPQSLGWTDRIPDRLQKIVGDALSGYEECFAGRGLGRFVWNRDLFFVGDPEKQPHDVLDVSGGTRPLVYGPYIHLPGGSWTARVHFGVSGEASLSPYLVDVFCEGQQLAAATIHPNLPGIHVADLHFSLSEPSGRGLEIRITVLDPNAKGHLAFGYVVLSPPGMHHPEAGIEWEEQFRAILNL